MYFANKLFGKWYIKQELPKKKKYEFSIFTMTYDSEDILDEFVCYHKAIGVDHIYILENSPKSKLKPILQKYIDEGYVSYDYCNYAKPYADTILTAKFFEKVKNETQYFLVVDDDERLAIHNCMSIKDALPTFINNIAGICITDVPFFEPISNLEDFVFTKFTHYAKNLSQPCRCIVNTDLAKKVLSTHSALPKKGYAIVDISGKTRDYKDFVIETNTSKIYIAHFQFKTFEEYKKRLEKRKLRSFSGGNRPYSDGNILGYSVSKFANESTNDLFRFNFLTRSLIERYKGIPKTLFVFNKFEQYSLISSFSYLKDVLLTKIFDISFLDAFRNWGGGLFNVYSYEINADYYNKNVTFLLKLNYAASYSHFSKQIQKFLDYKRNFPRLRVVVLEKNIDKIHNEDRQMIQSYFEQFTDVSFITLDYDRIVRIK